MERRFGLTPAARILLLAVLVLVALGAAVLFSATFHRAYFALGDPAFFLKRQMLGVALGAAVLCAATFLPPRRWLAWAPALYGITILLLAAVLLAGPKINNAHRWLPLGFISVQPSELAKLVTPIMVAWLYDRRLRDSSLTAAKRRPLWFAALAALGLLGALIIVEPDYGSGLFILGVGGALLLLVGLPAAYVVAGVVLMVPAAVLLWHARGDELTERFLAFVRPEQVYQVQHSLTAISCGGILGKGFGESWEKTGYLPEAHNDFIFGVYAEETGLVGVAFLIGLFALLLHAGWRVVRECPEPALRIIAGGFVLNLVLQAAMNIAVASASAPTKGIPLPFISHGSSGLTIALLEVGIILAIARASGNPAVPPAPAEAPAPAAAAPGARS
ncbi:MAG: FtsW/RodA/SpoVE family cell cycle protein [Planctomycetes bacterium]|nr:FtsW/RodA/SpoVE family cell cycle protein [Planctomycetota bacterium]